MGKVKYGGKGGGGDLNNIWRKETKNEEKPNIGKSGPNNGDPEHIDSINSTNFIGRDNLWMNGGIIILEWN